MSASHAQNEHDTHETHPHPPMPAVTDEAADTPMWVPIVGVVTFVLIVLFVMIRASLSAPEVVPGSDVTDEAHAAEAVVAPPAPQQ